MVLNGWSQKVPFTKPRGFILAALAVAALAFILGSVAAGKEPTAEVKRMLFPAQNALGVDSLDLAEREARKALAVDPEVTATHLILGEVALRRGELSNAEVAFKKALELGGATAAAQAGLAMVALANEDFTSASTAAAAALAADKGNWHANFAMGRVVLEQGKLEEASKYFEKGKGLKGRGDGRDLFDTGMGLLALADRDPQGAETSFIKARAAAPNTISSTMNLAAMYESTEQWAQAANVLQAAESKFGGSPLLSYRLGRAMENQQQWNDALRQYQKALKADSTFTPAMAALGHLYLLDKSKTAVAVDMLSKAVARHPTNAARLDLGIALTRSGKAAEGIQHLETVAAEDPSPATKVALARAYVLADMVDKSLPLYEDIDVQTDAPAGDFMNLANALIKVKRYDEARTYLDKALEKDPNLSEVYAKRGLIDLLEKKYEPAIGNFQKKLEMDPKSATTWMNLGGAQLALGKKGEAFQSYRKAAAEAPNSGQVWAALGAVLLADSTAAAQKAYDRALQLDPQSKEALKGRGLTFLLQEKYPEAIRDLKAASQQDPNDAETWVNLGHALVNSGNRAEGRTAYERALKLDPGNQDAQEGMRILNAAGAR